MKAIHKYIVPIQEEVFIDMPQDAEVIRIDGIEGLIYLWAIIDTEAPFEKRKFYLYKTGGKMRDDIELKYLGCGGIFVQMELMLYVFEETTLNPQNTYIPDGKIAYAYNKKSLELSNTILINDLSNYSIDVLDEMYVSDKKTIKKHIGSKYKYIGFKKKSGRMKCDKFFILFTIDKKRAYHGYFDTEEDALSVLRIKYGDILNDIGSLK